MCPPGQGRAPRSVANSEAGFDVGHFIGWRYISSGCSTGSHTTFHASPRSRVWTGLLWPRDMHAYNIYIPVEAPPPQRRAFVEGTGKAAPVEGPAPDTLARHPPRQPQGPGAARGASGAHARRCPAPAPPLPLLFDSLPSAAPPIHPSSAANWRMLGAYWDRRPGPRATGVPCCGWMDGLVAQVHAASPAVRLPSRCHFAAPRHTLTAHFDASPPRPRRERPAV